MGGSVRLRDSFQPGHEHLEPELETFLAAALGERTGERHDVGKAVGGECGEVVADLVYPLRRGSGVRSIVRPGATSRADAAM